MIMQPDHELDRAIEAVNRLKQLDAQDAYSKLRNTREKATFTMMMKMNPEALTNIRKEFFAREDSITLDEFIYIIQKHLTKGKDDSKYKMETPEQREFGSNMYELFRDIDVNGDGQLEWQEFTTFTVEKANLLNKRAKLTSIAHYFDCTSELDVTALYRHRHDISRFVNIPALGQFAMVEDHRNSIFVFNSRLGKHVATIGTEAAPIAIECIPEGEKATLVTSAADMTLATYNLDDPNPKRKYKLQSSWATPGVQMALAYAQDSRSLYSGATNGNIYSWNVQERTLNTTLTGHTDIVMGLIILKKLDNIASASLDKTLGVWDSHTNEQILKLHGHRKGVFDLCYNPSYRLIVSCGFEHDACVWSPFVNSMVYRLKGHHASLVGCVTVENTPELITADTSGVFKLWDVRNFQCVQTFSANLSGQEMKDSSTLTCFFHSRLPSRNVHQKEDDSRIYAASKNLFAFEQARVVHEATTDHTNVNWIAWNEDSCSIITASEKSVIVWDALIGSRTFTHTDICGEEISACCLDDRKRKMLIGDINGKIGVYNTSNGALMKTVHHVVNSAVISLEYYSETKRFIAGYYNGVMNIYDENVLEDCNLIRTFEHYNMHPELQFLKFNPATRCAVTSGTSSGILRFWDYDSGKCEFEATVTSHKSGYIVYVGLLDPYPLIVTSDSNCNIVIWASKGVKWVGLRIAAFVNATPAESVLEPIPRVADEEDLPPRRSIPRNGISRVSSQDYVIEAMADKYKDLHLILKNRNSFNLIEELFGDGEDVRTETTTKAAQELKDSERQWGRCAAAQLVAWQPDNFKMFAGDDLGTIRCFDLSFLFEDLDHEAMLRCDDPRITGNCREMLRTPSSALYPTLDQKDVVYLVGRPHDSTAYLGVDFCWSMTAHNDRIITMLATPHGVLSSSAERLVKMWSFDGRPLGTLLQSVPVGVRSRMWDLVLDVDSIIERENKQLDEIIEEVTKLVENPDKPDISTMDFSGMELGAKAAEFSRSDLRQRVEKSSQRLGIDFSSPSKPPISVLLTSPGKNGTLTRFNSSLLPDDYSFDGSHSVGNKSLDDALKELKSTDPSVNFELKTKGMTIIQKKRKAHKLVTIAKTFEEKSGVDVVRNSLDLKVMEATNSSSQPTGDGVNAADRKSIDFDKLMKAHGTDRPFRDEASVNADLYSLDTISKTSKLKPLTSVFEDGSMSTFGSPPKHSHVKSKIAESIAQARDRGERTVSIRKSCSKFTSFDALESSIRRNQVPQLSPELVKELRTKRELKYKDISRSRNPSSIVNNLTYDSKDSQVLGGRILSAMSSSDAYAPSKDVTVELTDKSFDINEQMTAHAKEALIPRQESTRSLASHDESVVLADVVEKETVGSARAVE